MSEQETSQQKKRRKKLDLDWQSLRPYASWFLLLGILLLFIPIVMVQPWLKVDFSETGQIGDTIGGTTTPFIGFIGVGVTFLAFWIQFEANRDQRKDIAHERFESKFFELLRLHQANVHEMEISGPRGSINGRKLLMRMFYEFKFIYYVFKQKTEDATMEGTEFTERELIGLAYRVFFHGLSENVEETFNKGLDEKSEKLYELVKEHLEDTTRAEYKSHKDKNKKGDYEETIKLKDGISYTCKFIFYPFDGHQNRLPHYFRNLFQMAKYVIDEKEVELTFDEKYEYIKMIRAQLSNFEQLLLYYNSFVFGKDWIKDQLFTEYRLIKNLPLSQASFGVKPSEVFSEKNSRGRHIFEDNEK